MTSGLLVVDKPLRWTSFDVIRRVRAWTKEKRVGHTGTLDPMATGVLVVAVGNATKWIPFLVGGTKVYEASIHLGIQTNTDDAASESIVLHEAPLSQVQALSPEEIKAALQSQEGWREQAPPWFSAKKVEGVRMYQQARQVSTWNDPDALAPLLQQQASKHKTVWIEKIELLQVALPLVKIRVFCGAGTYIRSIARDLGKQLGVGGHLASLRRTQVGTLSLQEATTGIDSPEVPALRWIPYSQALSSFNHLQIDTQEVTRLQQGVLLPSLRQRLESVSQKTLSPESPWVILCKSQESPVGVVRQEQGTWKIARVFF